MFDWLWKLLGIAKVVEYLFRCFVCGLEEILSLADAKKRGWTYKQGSEKGWRCRSCSVSTAPPL